MVWKICYKMKHIVWTERCEKKGNHHLTFNKTLIFSFYIVKHRFPWIVLHKNTSSSSYLSALFKFNDYFREEELNQNSTSTRFYLTGGALQFFICFWWLWRHYLSLIVFHYIWINKELSGLCSKYKLARSIRNYFRESIGNNWCTLMMIA